MGNSDWNYESRAYVTHETQSNCNDRQRSFAIDIEGVNDPLLAKAPEGRVTLRGSAIEPGGDQWQSIVPQDALTQGDLAFALVVFLLAVGVVTVIIALASQMNVLLLSGVGLIFTAVACNWIRVSRNQAQGFEKTNYVRLPTGSTQEPHGLVPTQPKELAAIEDTAGPGLMASTGHKVVKVNVATKQAPTFDPYSDDDAHVFTKSTQADLSSGYAKVRNSALEEQYDSLPSRSKRKDALVKSVQKFIIQTDKLKGVTPKSAARVGAAEVRQQPTSGEVPGGAPKETISGSVEHVATPSVNKRQLAERMPSATTSMSAVSSSAAEEKAESISTAQHSPSEAALSPQCPASPVASPSVSVPSPPAPAGPTSKSDRGLSSTELASLSGTQNRPLDTPVIPTPPQSPPPPPSSAPYVSPSLQSPPPPPSSVSTIGPRSKHKARRNRGRQRRPSADGYQVPHQSKDKPKKKMDNKPKKGDPNRKKLPKNKRKGKGGAVPAVGGGRRESRSSTFNVHALSEARNPSSPLRPLTNVSSRNSESNERSQEIWKKCPRRTPKKPSPVSPETPSKGKSKDKNKKKSWYDVNQAKLHRTNQ